MSAKTLMIQGTASHVGKSVLVTALCRLFRRQGLRVAPFKAQNMALNSFVTPDGKEIGWAQAVQAEAAGLLPRAEFNPVLLKPTGDKRSQVIVDGKPIQTMSARDYEKFKPRLWGHVTKALDRLREEFDLVVIEGAGSPAEINLKKNDIVNMCVALHANSPVLLVSDIDRGGVFASLLGTLDLLTAAERKLVKGLVINKFRGDVEILRPGLRTLTQRTRKPVLGVLPVFDFAYHDQEDSVALEDAPSAGTPSRGKVRVAVIRTPRISNFTDFDSLRAEPCVNIVFAQKLQDLESVDLIILPGSKNTLNDFHWLEKSGMAAGIRGAAHAGVFVLGICGGYQMLGEAMHDPHGVESSAKSSRGLGLLDVVTTFYAEKSLHQVTFAAHAMAADALRSVGKCTGYEIHMGQTQRGRAAKPLFRILSRSGLALNDDDGASNKAGNVMGTYIHGLLANDTLRHALLRRVAARRQVRIPNSGLLHNYSLHRKKVLNRLADWAQDNLDMRAIRRMAGVSR